MRWRGESSAISLTCLLTSSSPLVEVVPTLRFAFCVLRFAFCQGNNGEPIVPRTCLRSLCRITIREAVNLMESNVSSLRLPR